MKITKITEDAAKSYRIYIDEEFAFTLRKGEFYKLKPKVGQELSEDAYNAMYKLVLTRGKKYALHLLQDMDKTVRQLHDKLAGKGYPEPVIAAVVTYLEGFGYLNDAAFAQRIVENKRAAKSAQELRYYLRQKGFDRAVIADAMELSYTEDSEAEAIRKLLAKKLKKSNPSREEKQKVIAYFTRKGFNYEKVRQIVEQHEQAP